MTEIIYLNLQKSRDFQIFCSISIPPRRHRILFSFKANFPIITKYYRYHEKNRNIAQKTATNSEPAPSKNKIYYVKFNNSQCYKCKFIQKSRKVEGFTLCTMCGSDFSIAQEEKMISVDRYKETSKHKGYVDAAQRQRKSTNFGASSVTANLNQKVLKAELLFSGLLVNTTSL